MNAKRIYFAALRQFRIRNAALLPQLQLQHGRNERWLVREFALAMNSVLADSSRMRSFSTYADCERGYADITVWQGDGTNPIALYEAKAIYVDDDAAAYVGGAKAQLANGRFLHADRRLGLFFCVYARPGEHPDLSLIADFKYRVRSAVRQEFYSDHDIRLTSLVKPTVLRYSRHPWHTASWITWGIMR